jgi:hypothetical protein
MRRFWNPIEGSEIGGQGGSLTLLLKGAIVTEEEKERHGWNEEAAAAVQKGRLDGVASFRGQQVDMSAYFPKGVDHRAPRSSWRK